MVRFLIYDEITKSATNEKFWLIPNDFRNHSFLHGDLFPNRLFPCWATINIDIDMDPYKCVELRRWCEKNCQGDSLVMNNGIAWELRDDFLLFLMAWDSIILDHGTLEI